MKLGFEAACLRPYILCHSAVFLFLVSHSFFLSFSLSFLLSFLFLYLSFCLSLSLFILLWLSLCLSHSVCHVSLSQDLSLTLKLSLSFLSRLGFPFLALQEGLLLVLFCSFILLFLVNLLLCRVLVVHDIWLTLPLLMPLLRSHRFSLSLDALNS
jgi:hypothetical protein